MFIKQKLFGYSPKSFCLINKHILFCFYLYLIWQITLLIPQNFSLAFIDELEKQILIKKTIEVGQ